MGQNEHHCVWCAHRTRPLFLVRFSHNGYSKVLRLVLLSRNQGACPGYPFSKHKNDVSVRVSRNQPPPFPTEALTSRRVSASAHRLRTGHRYCDHRLRPPPLPKQNAVISGVEVPIATFSNRQRKPGVALRQNVTSEKLSVCATQGSQLNNFTSYQACFRNQTL